MVENIMAANIIAAVQKIHKPRNICPMESSSVRPESTYIKNLFPTGVSLYVYECYYRHYLLVVNWLSRLNIIFLNDCRHMLLGPAAVNHGIFQNLARNYLE